MKHKSVKAQVDINVSNDITDMIITPDNIYAWMEVDSQMLDPIEDNIPEFRSFGLTSEK